MQFALLSQRLRRRPRGSCRGRFMARVLQRRAPPPSPGQSHADGGVARRHGRRSGLRNWHSLPVAGLLVVTMRRWAASLALACLVGRSTRKNCIGCDRALSARFVRAGICHYCGDGNCCFLCNLYRMQVASIQINDSCGRTSGRVSTFRFGQHLLSYVAQ